MVSLAKAFPNGFVTQKPKPASYVSATDPRMAFVDHMRAVGFSPPTFFQLGKLIRCPAPNGKAGDDSGWFVYHEFPDALNKGGNVGVGVFGSWRGEPERETWVSKRAEIMSQEERAALSENIERAQQARLADQERTWAETATQAAALWAGLPDAEAHPYLAAKRIAPHGTKLKGEALVVPVYGADGSLQSLQYIWPDRKRFMTGGKTRGGFFVIQGKDDFVIVCEGFATGATMAEATGATVYVAFNAGNLIDVTQIAKTHWPDARLIVAGDDDIETAGNPGRTKATAAAELSGCEVVFPTVPTDFNDMACAGHDVEALFNPAPVTTKASAQTKASAGMPQELMEPRGMLGDIVAYYKATARQHEGGYAIQSAIALASVVCGRNFRTNNENFSALYFLNVGKSSSGKEHGTKVCERILEAAGQHDRMIGGGYTSAGAVYSALMRTPRHLAVIDEFGMYLQSAGNSRNTNLMEANKEIMSMIGRVDGIARPQAYSTMTLTKERADEVADRKIYNPSITMLAMTTPVKLYENISSVSVADGFLGRFLIYQSEADRGVGRMRPPIDVPQQIVAWVNAIAARAGVPVELAAERPKMTTLYFTQDAEQLHAAFGAFCVNLCNELERARLEELPGRSNEMSMRLALIAALCRDPHTDEITEADSAWAIAYVKFCLLQAVRVFKMKVSGSQFEGEKKNILAAIKDRGAEGITWGEMQKTPPFSYSGVRTLTEIVDALVDAGSIIEERLAPMGRGRPSRKPYRYWHKSFIEAKDGH